MAIFFTGAFIPLWILPNSFGKLSAGAFFVQFGVQGAWGVIPIYLAESSPASFRASFGGIAYQLGNMISSAAAQIEARAGESLRVVVNGRDLPDYASVQGILIGVVLFCLRESVHRPRCRVRKINRDPIFQSLSFCAEWNTTELTSRRQPLPLNPEPVCRTASNSLRLIMQVRDN